jgi:hypothetical protein
MQSVIVGERNCTDNRSIAIAHLLCDPGSRKELSEASVQRAQSVESGTGNRAVD